jgi:hypothetical protein
VERGTKPSRLQLPEPAGTANEKLKEGVEILNKCLCGNQN